LQASEACFARPAQLKPETTTKEEAAARKRKRLLGMTPYPLMSEALRQTVRTASECAGRKPAGATWLKYNDRRSAVAE
jgi:hypothetical protein